MSSYRSISRDNEHNRGDRRDYKDYRSNRDSKRENYDRYYNNGNNRRSRSRSRDRRRSSEKDLYNEIINQDNQSNNSYGGGNNNNRNYDRGGGYDRKSRDRDGRDRRNRDERDYDYRKPQQQQQSHSSSYYDDDCDSQSDPGENNAEQIPNNKIIVRGLAQHITEADIQCDLIQCNLKPTFVRLIRKKKTGQSRGFAFVEFQSTAEATEWLNMKNNVLILQNQYRALLQYSFIKDVAKDMPIASDWYCGKCGVFNFKRRESCFKCQASKEESEKGGEGSDEVSNILTKKIMLRNLDALTNEEVVLCALQEAIPKLVAKVSKILICRDALTNTSRGICYLYFENLVDSMTTNGALKALETPLLIDGREVCISYCMDSENRAIVKNQQQQSNNHYSQYSKMPENPAYPSNYQYSLSDVNSLAEFSAGQFATENTAEYDHYIKYYREYYTTLITQGQMGEQQSLPQSQLQHSGGASYVGAQVAQSALERRTTKNNQHRTREPEPLQPLPNGKDGKKYPTPDQSQFVFDDATGYYYDPTSRLYYHPTSQCFWNSEIGKYLYWDDDNKTFVLHVETKVAPVLDNKVAEPMITAPPPPIYSEDSKRNEYQPQDKVKSAKKIVKDMEKWAKQQNQRKEFGMITSVQRSEDSQSPPMQPVMRPLETTAADVGFSILEKKDRPLPVTTTLSSFLPNNNNKLVSYGSDSDHDEELQQVNEADCVDFEKLTCLICKRGFQTADILTKHLKMSNLHKENLQKFKMQKGVLEIGAGASNLSYRDRAKERRLKYGEVDPPPVNKSRERFHREIEKQTTTTTYQANNVAQTPISQSNVGNKLLQKMGWVEGQGLGRSNQGRTEIIETESRIANAGLGSKHAAYGATGDDYKTYIKKMMKSRYEQN